MNHTTKWLVATVVLTFVLAGCNDGGGGGLRNKDPGNNDINVVVAFGDSITSGSECSCPSYPGRVAGMINKTVRNTGVPGSRAVDNIQRTQSAIDKYNPGFMLILYGINDVIHSYAVDSILSALDQMVAICKKNNVVPVLATFPEPIEGRALFAPRALLLNQGIRDLAKRNSIKCVDLEREFRGKPSLYEADGLHPNDDGTRIVAFAFADLF